MQSKIKLQIQTEAFIRKLGRAGNALQLVAAETLNESAEEIDHTYQRRLQRRQRIRTKFTLNSIKIFRATGIRRSGEPRLLSRINALLGVRKMRGGKKHYLAELEEGSTSRGNPRTLGNVPIPLNTARTAKSESRPISGPNRLTKQDPQTLQVGGSPIGVRGDGMSQRQRWAIMYSQRKSGFNRIQGDPRKPFYFIGNDGLQGIYKLMGSVFRKIRNLDKRTVKTKARPHFKAAFREMTPQRIQALFIKKARQRLGGR